MKVYSKEFYLYRDKLIRDYNSIDKSVYNRLLLVRQTTNIPINIDNDYDTIYHLYINERVSDEEIAGLCGLSAKGMEAKRRRLGIKDRPSDFEITLQITQIALNNLGVKAYIL